MRGFMKKSKYAFYFWAPLWILFEALPQTLFWNSTETNLFFRSNFDLKNIFNFVIQGCQGFSIPTLYHFKFNEYFAKPLPPRIWMQLITVFLKGCISLDKTKVVVSLWLFSLILISFCINMYRTVPYSFKSYTLSRLEVFFASKSLIT